MRTLILLRHAKAVTHSPDGDFGRELAPRGRAQADRLGRWLANKPFAPALVYASPARRTRETADLAIAALPHKPERIDEASLYNADAADILALIRAAPNERERLMVVGHNPGMAEVANFLAGSGEPAALLSLGRKYPTCACAVLEFAGDWSEIGARRGALLTYITPKSLDASELDD
jgi:phosphohistidine phosphatase